MGKWAHLHYPLCSLWFGVLVPKDTVSNYTSLGNYLESHTTSSSSLLCMISTITWHEVVSTAVTAWAITDFIDTLFAQWGLSLAILTDNGVQFVSAEFEAFWAKLGIHHIWTALCQLQINCGVEDLNQIHKNGIRGTKLKVMMFFCILLHYRIPKHTTTGCSPASLMLAYEL